MATNTTNLSLIKPDLTDKIRIAQINQNMDIIDEKLGPVGSTSLQSQVTPLTTKTANYDKLIENGTDLNSLLTTGVYKSPATAAGVHTLSNCPIETPFVMVVRGDGEVDGCVQLLCGGVAIYTRRGTNSGFPSEWTVPTGGATPSGEYSIDDLYDAIDELLADAKDEIVAELVDDTAGEGDTGKVWSADKVATTFDEKANVDGYYDDLTAGNAEQLISTVNIKDTALYTFRTAGGSADIGDREVDKLIGGTIVWNQGFKAYSRGSSSGITYGSANNGKDQTMTGTATANSYNRLDTSVQTITGHVYYVDKHDPTNNSNILIYNDNNNGVTTGSSNATIGKASADKYFYIRVANGTVLDNLTITPQIFDLTKMFGSTIADYVYGLEVATPGAGVAWFRRLFPKDYYAYNAGQLMSVNVASHDMVGFNQWDEEWTKGYYDAETGQLVVQSASTTTLASVNKIKVLPNTNYSVTTPTASSVIFEYDSDGTYIKRTSGIQGVFTTQPQTYEIAFHIANYGSGEYNNDVCINLSWDGERDGEYEAYEKHSYTIGNVELRGIPQLDADNHLQYDGDIYESDGTVTRKYYKDDLSQLTPQTRYTGTTNKTVSMTLNRSYDRTKTPQAISSKYPIIGDASGVANLASPDGKSVGIYWYRQNSGTSTTVYVVLPISDSPEGELLYELATPTTESVDPYQNPQIVDDFGTEEYVDRGVATSARDVSIPVGHETYYQANLRAKLEMAPNSPADGDGDYVVRQTSGTNEYIKLENAEAIVDLDTKKADMDGYYDNLTAGNAEQLISTIGITDNAPYNFRTSGGSVDIGDRMTDKLIGGTIAWNQLILTNLKSGSKTPPGNRTYDLYTISPAPTIENHVYFVSVEYTYNGERTDIRPYIQFGTGTNVSYVAGGSDKFFNVGNIGHTQKFGGFTQTKSDLMGFNLGMTSTSTITSDDTWSFDNLMCIDITQMFGSAIADYAMTIGSGEGVAWFTKMFPKPYYAYNTGELMSVNIASHDMVGFNAWDGEYESGYYDVADGSASETSASWSRSKNPIPCLPNTTYYFMQNQSTGGYGYMLFYGADGEYLGQDTALNLSNYANIKTFTTPKNAYFIKFYNNIAKLAAGACINLSWDGERDGEYEPYVKRSYPLGDVELRGIPKLDANDSLYYDGDIYESDGTVTRRYGVVDLGSVTWAISSELFYATLNDRFVNGVSGSGVCSMYPFYGRRTWTQLVNELPDKQFAFTSDSAKKYITIKNSTYSDAASFKTAVTGVYLVYELATPTTETADPYQNPQIVDDFGTEEYVDRGVATSARDVAIPVGHETYYQANLRAKLEMAPNSPADGDGDYIVRQTSGTNEYIKLENAEAITDLDAKKADIDGYYEQLTVGNAEQLVSTVGITDKVPYNFRTSGGSADIGDRMVDKIVGGTIVWNQLVQESKKSGTTTPPGTQTYSGWSTSYLAEANHAYVIRAKITYNGNKLPLRVYAALGVTGVYAGPAIDIETAGITDAWLSGSTTAIPTTPIVIGVSKLDQSILTSDDAWSIDNVSIFDITKMFGVDIGNYFLSLSHANRKKWFDNLFPKPYYDYNAGELLSVNVASHDTIGFNAWDEEWELGSFNETTGAKMSGTVSIRSKNYIPVIPGAKYHYKSPFSSRRLYYDANKNFLSISNMVNGQIFTVPDNAYYMMFRSGSGTTTYENNVCINLHWDGERDGEYEPYIKRSYPLGDVELRGIPKLDANNSLYYDGDEYTDDGTVTRKYGIVDLGTLTWMDSSTSGRFYARTTPNPAYKNTNNSIFVCAKYEYNGYGTSSQGYYGNNKTIRKYNYAQSPSTAEIYVHDDAYTTAADFKTAMSGVMLVYELATPTTETTDAFQNPQIVDDFGTEEYVDTRDVLIPVGHETVYQPNLRAKLEMSPDSPDGDGDYIVRQSNGENTYVPLVIPTELPTTPTTDGTYVLKVTVSSGTPTLTWVAQ